MNEKKPRFSVSVDNDLYDKINNYQHDNRIKSQTQAIAEILKIGIQSIMEETKNFKEIDTVSAQPKDIFPEFLAKIIQIYNQMNAIGQEKLLEYAKDLSINDRYKKCDSISQKSVSWLDFQIARADEFAAMACAQFLQEKKQELQASSAQKSETS